MKPSETWWSWNEHSSYKYEYVIMIIFEKKNSFFNSNSRTTNNDHVGCLIKSSSASHIHMIMTWILILKITIEQLHDVQLKPFRLGWYQLIITIIITSIYGIPFWIFAFWISLVPPLIPLFLSFVMIPVITWDVVVIAVVVNELKNKKNQSAKMMNGIFEFPFWLFKFFMQFFHFHHNFFMLFLKNHHIMLILKFFQLIQSRSEFLNWI